MKYLKTLLILIGSISNFSLSNDQIINGNNNSVLADVFQQYQILNDKRYHSPQEKDYRFQIFKDNAQFLLGDLDNINDKIKLKEKYGKKFMVVANHNPCQEELALNDFMDFSNQEFSKNYLLQPNFFDTHVYNPIDKIYEPGLENFNGFSYQNNPEWIQNEIESVLQDPNFDIFDETLRYRQNSLDLYEIDHDYQYYQRYNNLLGYTKYDDKYYQQQIKLFLFESMPNYNPNLHNNIEEDQDEIELQKECQNYLKQINTGRRLQYKKFNQDTFWSKYFDQLAVEALKDEEQGINNYQYGQYDSISTKKYNNSFNYNDSKNTQRRQNYRNYQPNIKQVAKKNNNKIFKQQQKPKENKIIQQKKQQSQVKVVKQNKKFEINEQTKVYKTNQIPPKFIAISNGIIKTFDYNPKQKMREEQQRKEKLIKQIRQMIQQKKSQQNIRKQQKQQPYYKKITQQKQPNQQRQNFQQQKFQSQKNNTKKQKALKKKSINKNNIMIEGIELPKYVNWQDQTQFTPVKNQRKCNACYAFGALATLEAHIALKYKKQLPLSEQEILDCSPGNQACNGGQPYLVYDYIKDNGVNLQKDYPYKAKKQSCNRKMDRYRYKKISGRIFVKPGMLNLLKAVNFGPVAVVSHASDFLKYFYDGTFSGRGCYNKKTPNHASMLYGYNLNAPQPYLMFKNNWGLSWGNRGYYKVTIGELSNKNLGHCLIAETTFNVIPII